MRARCCVLLCYLCWISLAKPLCRELTGAWRDCRIQVGGLTIQGAEAFQSSFGPTFQQFLTDSYNETYGFEFQALPLDFNETFEFVGAAAVDFIFSNPSTYTCMAVEFEVNLVASLINFRRGFALDRFAGVIFARANSSFVDVADLSRGHIEAVSLSGLGAMQLQQAELLQLGLDVMTDVPRLTFAFNQNDIVQDVQNGLADVGFVRTDLIDRLVAANLTKWENFRVIGEIQNTDGFPFRRSTSFTPEWPIGALKHTPHEVRELVGRALMSLDRSSMDPKLSEPAVKGSFASWTTPNNYLGLLNMLERIRYLDTTQRRCLRSSDEYDAIFCPPGYVKKSREQVYCPDCREGYSCLCAPCAKLRDPEYVLKAEVLNTSWMGSIDVEQVDNATVLAGNCSRMKVCGRVFSGQKLRWVVLDQIGAQTRRAINAPLITEVEFRMSIDGPSTSTIVQNVTFEDLETQMFYLEYEVQGKGTQVIQIDINGAPAPMSPVVLEVDAPPKLRIRCPEGSEVTEDGQCQACPPGTVSPGGGARCRPCDPGTRQPLSSQSTCESCPVGEYQALVGSVSCIPCEPGSSSRGKAGSQACSPCEPGQSAPNNGSERCTPCARGSFAEVEGAAQCEQCPGGQGTFEQGANNRSLCVCLRNERLTFRNSTGNCVPCGIGVRCDGGNQDPLQAAGFWVDSIDSGSKTIDVFRCRSEAECPAGPLGTCARGRTGRACNNCEAWHRRSNVGECAPCEGVDVLPVLFLMVGAITLAGFAWYLSQISLAKRRSSGATALLTGGQVIVLMQLMAALQNLDFQWTGPAVPMLHALSLLSFDWDLVRWGCIVSNSGPVSTFILQLISYPLFSLTMLAVWLFLGKWHREVLARLFNVNCLILMTLYVTLTVVALLPWQCISNPNGSYAMQTQPGVLCFSSEEHTLLLGLSVLGLLMYPVPMLAVSIRATVMYPYYVASGQGLIIVKQYSFIFERFRSPCYFFGVLYLVRNTLLSLIPVVLANYPSIQVVTLATVMLLGMMVQMRSWPWKTKMANITDMVFSTGVVLFLVIAGPILSFETDADRDSYAMFLSWSFVALLLSFFMALCLVIALYLRRSFTPRKPYKLFLTHHKYASGSLARFIKCVLSKYSNHQVYLDSDELRDLDVLFECIRSEVEYLVPLITPCLMTRPWCVGELATAFLNQVTILPVSCNGTTFMPERMAAILTTWTSDDFQPLLAAGIDEQAIKAMVEHLGSLKAIPYDRRGHIEQQEASILGILSRCDMKRRTFTDFSAPSSDARILVLTHTEYEAISAGLILQMLLQQQLQEHVLMPDSVEQMTSALPRAEALVIVLHNGILYDPVFAGMIMAALAASTGSYEVGSPGSRFSRVSSGSSGGDVSRAWRKLVLVNADSSFIFPGHEFYTSLPTKMGELALIGAYKTLFRKICLPFSGHASQSMIHHQVKEIAKRLQELLSHEARHVDMSSWGPSQDLRESFSRDADSDSEEDSASQVGKDAEMLEQAF